MPSGPVRLATAAMAFATASSAGAAATASWFDSPRQIRPSREIASLVRSIWSASCSETTTPKARTSSVAWRSVAVSIRAHGDGAFLAEELTGDGGALGGGHEALDGRVDRPHPLIQRQRDQVGGRQSQPLQRVGGGASPGGRLAETARQILRRLFDAGHGDTGQFARTLQRLDRGDRRAQRLRELGLRIDRLQPGADHGDARSRGSGHGSGSSDRDTARKRREPGIGRFHLPAEPSEPARPGLADTFQLGAHLSAAHRRKADRNALFSHWNDPSVR